MLAPRRPTRRRANDPYRPARFRLLLCSVIFLAVSRAEFRGLAGERRDIVQVLGSRKWRFIWSATNAAYYPPRLFRSLRRKLRQMLRA